MFARRFPRSFLTLLPYFRRSASSSRSITRTSHHRDSESHRRLLLPPRQFPSSGFEVINPSQKVEEEKLHFYSDNEYYPIRIGMVIKDRYQVVAKLGFGTSSTVWLCHDLGENKYWTLKIHVNTLKSNWERKIYKHLASVGTEHTGQQFVRQLEDSFKLDGPHGEHDVFIMLPLGMSLRTLQEMQKNHVFHQTLVVNALDQVLRGLDFLHWADVTHTGILTIRLQDIHSDNLLIAMTDDSILSKMEQDELHKPSARKQVDGATIYVSRYMLGGAGPLTICDLGQARIGGEHTGSAMPMQYRAPEVILNMSWGHAVDVWSVGLLARDLLERETLFSVYDRESKEMNDAHHLAAMVALLGPPPPEFLSRSKETSKYWHQDGKWKSTVPIPTERTLESLASALAGEDRDMFLDFMRSLLCWLPEERLTTGQAYYHGWLRDRSQSEKPQS